MISEARRRRTVGEKNSLVVAHLRVGEAGSLRELASALTSSSEREALRRRAWAILLPVHALLLRRLADDTLLPGTIKEEEVTYLARSQAFVLKAMDKPVPSEAVLQHLGAMLGYTTLLKAVFHTLALLMDGGTRITAATGECAQLCFDGVGRHPTNGNDAEQDRG